MEEIERLENNEEEKKDPKNIKIQETQVLFLTLDEIFTTFFLEKNQHYKRTEDFL